MYDSTYFKDEFNNINYPNDNVGFRINGTFRKNPGNYLGIDDPTLYIQTFLRNDTQSDDILYPENENMSIEEEPQVNLIKEIKETEQIKVNAKLKKECPPIEPKIIRSIKEENLQGIFHLFTKKPDDQIDYIKEYFENPIFKDFNLIKKDKKKNKKRKNDMDNISKKIRQEISNRLVKRCGDELNKLSFKEFNQIGKKTKNKKYLSMNVKEFLKSILLENIREKTKNNNYILTKEDEKFIESLANDDEGLKFILNMKMEDIYNEFFNSKEYQDLIKELIDQKNDYYYIHLFIENNKNFVGYYKEAEERKKNN